MQGDLAAVGAGLIDKAENLNAQDRKDAGHEIEDQSAEECQDQRAEESAGCLGTWHLELGTSRRIGGAQWHIHTDAWHITLGQSQHSEQAAGVLRRRVVNR